MKKNYFSDANKIVKYQESVNYWMFKTGKKILKVKKKGTVASSVPMEELFCKEILRQLNQYSAPLNAELLTIKSLDNTFVIDKDDSLSSPPLYFVLSMNQLADRYFVNHLIAKKKLGKKTLDPIAHFLSHSHRKIEPCPMKEIGTSNSLNSQFQNLLYQSKKYLGVTISKPMIDMLTRPLEKYLKDNRKLLNGRIKTGKIKLTHGCFIPRKIHVTKKEVLILGKTLDPFKDRYSDIVSDIADFIVELKQSGEYSAASYFVEQYENLSGDTDVNMLLPIYEALKCLTNGLRHSINMMDLQGTSAENEKNIAVNYYQGAVDTVRQL